MKSQLWKKKTMKLRERAMKKSKIQEISDIKVDCQIQQKNTNKNQPDFIKRKRMQSKSTLRYQQIMLRIFRKRCTNLLSLKETIIQSLNEFQLEEITGKNKHPHFLNCFILNGLLLVGKLCLICFLCMVRNRLLIIFRIMMFLQQKTIYFETCLLTVSKIR